MHSIHLMSHKDGLGKAARCRMHEITGTQVQRLLAKLQVIDTFLPNIVLCEILSETDYSVGEANSKEDENGGKHVLQKYQSLVTCVESMLCTMTQQLQLNWALGPVACLIGCRKSLMQS